MKVNYVSQVGLVLIGLVRAVSAGVQAPMLNTIFRGLSQHQQPFNGITFAEPEINFITKGAFIQTPNAWGQTLDKFNHAISTPADGQKSDKNFMLPTCNESAQCLGGRECQRLPFLLHSEPSLCVGAEIQFQLRLYQAIISANKTVDITTLQPEVITQSAFSDGAFTLTLQRALLQLAVKANMMKQNISVTLLQGGVMPITATASLKRQLSPIIDPEKNFLKQIVESPDFPSKTPYFSLYVGTERSCYAVTGKCHGDADQKSMVFDVSWNHGKIIMTDGHSVITGGENFWGQDYLEKNPVNDLNIAISGPVAKGASAYIRTMWNYTRAHKNKLLWGNECAAYTKGTVTDDCPPASVFDNKNTAPLPNAGMPVAAMFVSKLNYNVLGQGSDASELARVIAFKSAKKTIQLSQQALFFKILPESKQVLHPIPTSEGNVISALAYAIDQGVNVSIVTSNLVGMSYSSCVSSDYLRQAIVDVLLKLKPHDYTDPQQAARAVNSHLAIKTIQYAKNDPNGKKTLSHDKLWIVDGRVFYIGSHNIYPSALQQFGVIVEDEAATLQLQQELWKPMWNNSRPASQSTSPLLMNR